MNILKNIIKSFLLIVILYYALYFTAVYKDTVLSIGQKRNLKGKIVYSVNGHYINVIALPSGAKKNIYAVPEEIRKQLGFVNDPSFSPDGKRIVFSKSEHLFGDDLYVVNSDGTGLRKFLDLGETSALCPSWSPDGRKIAFIVQMTKSQGVYIVDVDNPYVSLQKIVNIRPGKDQPSWSPNSKEIAFSSEERFRKSIGENLYSEVDLGGIYIADIFGKGVKKIINLASQPTWSPDGKKLVYGTIDGYYIVNVNEQIVYNSYLLIPYKTPFFGKGGSFPVRWSPDGKYIAFCREIWPRLAGIYVVDVDNPKKQIRIATDDEAIIGMSWVK